MGKNGKHRWKISLYHHRRRSSTEAESKPTQPPKEFVCPISGSMISDPVVVSSGQTFERVSVQVCRDLGFTPVLEDSTTPDFTTVIPNLAIKSTILSWCDSSGAEHPRPPDYDYVETIVRAKMEESSPPSKSDSNADLRVSERELLNNVAENPPVLFSHAATELAHRDQHFYSSSSEESVIVSGGGTDSGTSPFRPFPLATRPACLSPPSSNSSSEITEIENQTLNQDNISGSNSSCAEEEEIVAKLKSAEVHEQEQAAIVLRKLSRTKEEIRVSLCTSRLLLSLRSLIASRYCVVQTNAIASLVNLSLEKANKVKIVRSGFVPMLIDVLRAGTSESQEHAAGALFSLALEDENKMAIGVLGALRPLMYALRSESERTRHDSALALYHLSLIQSNRVKLVKLGAIPTLLSMVKSGESASWVLLILCNLASCNEGRSAMLDANAVAILVGLLRQGSGMVESAAIRENCVAALFALSHGNLRFKGLAKEARAAEALREIEERGSERAREKAKRILLMMRGREEEDAEVDWEGFLESGALSRTRHRVGFDGKNVGCPNSSNF